MSDEYLPPQMTNGKTWADESWWSGHTWDAPQTSDEARELAWARCWAYGEAKGMTTREWHLMWPIVYGALNAMSRVQTPTHHEPERKATAPRMTEPEQQSERSEA